MFENVRLAFGTILDNLRKSLENRQNVVISTWALVDMQPRPQGLLAFQYGGGKREDPGTQRTKTIADWCIPWCVHTCALIGLLLPKQRWWPFEGFEETDKCFLQCLRPKRWAEFRSDCLENCVCTVGRQRFEDSWPI